MLIKPQHASRLANNLVLLGLIVILFFLNYYTKTIFSRPTSIHQWRQTDCLSIAKNYYEEGMHFFNPKIHFQGPKGGNAVSECPLLNYSAAALWKVFGEHEFIYRLLEYLIFIFTVFILFNTIARFYKSWLYSYIVATIILTSPLLTYYGLNFIADVPAMSLGLACFCFFLAFYNTRKMALFYVSLVCGTLAVLMKASALMGLSLLVFFSMIDFLNLNDKLNTEKLFVKKTVPLICIFLSVMVIVAWYRFAVVYNLNNTNLIFLLTVLPIWEMEEQQIIKNLKILFNNLFPLFLNKPMFLVFMMAVMYVTANFKKLNTFYKVSFLATGLYFVAYLIFFFQVFSVHDYYLNNLMIFPAVSFLALAFLLSQNSFLALNRNFLRVFFIATFIFNGFHAAAMYRLRMIKEDKMVYWFPFITEEEQNLYRYLAWDYGNSIKKIEDFRPVLRKHNIKREDFVLSVPDQSFDISLYFMDQKGFTIAREHFMYDSTVTDHFKNKNLKYFIISDTTLKRQPAYKRIAPHLDFYFSDNGVDVFKVKPTF